MVQCYKGGPPHVFLEPVEHDERLGEDNKLLALRHALPAGKVAEIGGGEGEATLVALWKDDDTARLARHACGGPTISQHGALNEHALITMVPRTAYMARTFSCITHILQRLLLT